MWKAQPSTAENDTKVPTTTTTTTPSTTHDTAALAEFHGSESFLVGIAPNYWSHVPMTIADVNHLQLVNGFHCWVVRKRGQHQHVPVSKCLLVGYIVSASVRSSDEALLYVLDDGTGFIDCMKWSDEIEQLPTLSGPTSSSLSRHSIINRQLDTTNDVATIGELVRVFGKIQCVSIQKTNHENDEQPTIVREILASRIERIGQIGAQNDEVEHWRACIQQQQSILNNPTQWNAMSFLKLLGPQITTQVCERQDLPSADDTLGSWRVFGKFCQCHVDYKDDLLYCHCQAKVEPLDPEFIFRDAVLMHLWKLQEMAATSHSKPLQFLYKQIKTHRRLRDKAHAVLCQSSHGSTSSIITSKKSPKLVSSGMVDGLFIKTFSALRQDGIVHLMDEDKDQYVLISRPFVLEPHVQKSLEVMSATDAILHKASKILFQDDISKYLGKVHKDRLLYIKRCILNNSVSGEVK